MTRRAFIGTDGRIRRQRRERASQPTPRVPNMRTRLKPLVVLLAGLALVRCDYLDPRGVTNPNVTEDDYLRTSNAAENWTRGVERQLAAAINQVVMGTEVVSDNLFNNRTLFSKVFDIPQIDATDFDVTNIQSEIHRLRAMADQGLTTVVPADPNATDEIRAQLHFHRGFAHLLSGELFVGLPGEPEGAILAPAEHLALAAADFQRARDLTQDAQRRAAATLALARTHYQAGDRAAAVTAAQEVLATAPDVLRVVRYDVTDGPTNQMQFAIYDSGQNEFQPLPRLDFLFPKYYSTTAGEQKPIAILKGEEAFLILAEAALAQGDPAGARARLVALLDLIARRPTALIDDRNQLRGRRGGTWIYPNAAEIQVAASPGEAPRSGLVLTRTAAPVRIPVVSGTSVTREMLEGATTEEQLLELLYLMRQEIFVVEGRRMTDLGIRLPVAMNEAQVNPNVDPSSPALTARIPAFVPLDYGLDSFTYKDGDLLAVIHNNMNRVLVQNRTSDAVLPFH